MNGFGRDAVMQLEPQLFFVSCVELFHFGDEVLSAGMVAADLDSVDRVEYLFSKGCGAQRYMQ